MKKTNPSTTKRFWAAMAPKANRINHILEGPDKPTTPASMYGGYASDDPTVWVEVVIIPKGEYEELKESEAEWDRYWFGDDDGD